MPPITWIGRAGSSLATTLSGSLAVTADMTDFDGIRRVVADIHRHYGRIDGLMMENGVDDEIDNGI